MPSRNLIPAQRQALTACLLHGPLRRWDRAYPHVLTLDALVRRGLVAVGSDGTVFATALAEAHRRGRR